MKAGDLVSLKSMTWLHSATLWSADGKKVQGSFNREEVGVVLHFSQKVGKARTALVLTSSGALGWILVQVLKLCDRNRKRGRHEEIDTK